KPILEGASWKTRTYSATSKSWPTRNTRCGRKNREGRQRQKTGCGSSESRSAWTSAGTISTSGALFGTRAATLMKHRCATRPRSSAMSDDAGEIPDSLGRGCLRIMMEENYGRERRDRLFRPPHPLIEKALA